MAVDTPMTHDEQMKYLAAREAEARLGGAVLGHQFKETHNGSTRPTITDLIDHVAQSLARTIQVAGSLNDRISGPMPSDPSPQAPVPDGLYGRLVGLEQWALHLEHELQRLSESL